MKVAEFEKCFIGIPMKDEETREEIEDRFISALESVNEDCVATYTLKITEYDDRKAGEVVMTDNQFGYQINFGRETHRKARWKRARARWLKQYAKLCEKMGVQNDLQEGR